MDFAFGVAVVLVCLFANDMPECLFFRVHLTVVAWLWERLIAAEAGGNAADA